MTNYCTCARKMTAKEKEKKETQNIIQWAKRMANYKLVFYWSNNNAAKKMVKCAKKHVQQQKKPIGLRRINLLRRCHFSVFNRRKERKTTPSDFVFATALIKQKEPYADYHLWLFAQILCRFFACFFLFLIPYPKLLNGNAAIEQPNAIDTMRSPCRLVRRECAHSSIEMHRFRVLVDA